MKNKFLILFLFSLSYLQADHQNLIILVDTTQQEGFKKQDITVTHQLIVALQQRVAPILVSVSLWKNIVDRKKEFAKKLHDRSSKESDLYSLYKETNRQLKAAYYNYQYINQKFSASWFEQNYPRLASLPQLELDQLKFNFLSYNFDFDMSQWSVFDAQTGMLLFIPIGYQLHVDTIYQLMHEHDMAQCIEKKNHVLNSMQTFLHNNDDEWVIYVSGHGHPENNKQKAHITGMTFEDFSDFLRYLHNNLHTKLLVYSSCFAGGVHTVEPYKNMQLNYPAIVVALTDAPIYGFGYFEGVKLPPYNAEFQLTAQDIQVNVGLTPSITQKFDLFFKRAWSGALDMELVESISQFFMCQAELCSLVKVENMPLLRKKLASIFLPMQDTMTMKLVQQLTSSAAVKGELPLLLYVKKIDKIELAKVVPLISMLPGLQNHEIGELIADKIPLSHIINDVFLSLADAQSNKNYLIDKLSCYNDLVLPSKQEELTHVMVIQQGLIPKFLDAKSDAIISFKSGEKWYLVLWNDQKSEKIMTLSVEQISIMKELEMLMQNGIDFQSDFSSKKLVAFDAYRANKIYQHDIIESCVHHKVCKKW